ncbi:MAG TPA: DUF1289 domain-containing protein [Stellaceae bacterium]|jgi:hypothetical protein|nr:DUF1289 domain-containing protein [Stellaceae bacterium]
MSDTTDVTIEPHPVSPCIGICLMDPATRMCRGCLRKIEEIAGWYEATAAEKRAILARLAQRRAGNDSGAAP